MISYACIEYIIVDTYKYLGVIVDKYSRSYTS